MQPLKRCSDEGERHEPAGLSSTPPSSVTWGGLIGDRTVSKKQDQISNVIMTLFSVPPCPLPRESTAVDREDGFDERT